MRKFSIYFLLMIFVSTVLTSCKKDPIVNLAEGKTVTVDATSYDTWTYFSFSTGDVVTVSDPATDTNWDLGFMRNHIRTNGGTTGNGQGAVYDAGVVSFESLLVAPETGYIADVDTVVHTIMDFTQDPPVTYVDVSASGELETWGAFDYQQNPPPFIVSDKIFVVKTADAKFTKVHFQAYSNADGTGHITFEYKYQADGTTNIE